MRLLQVDENGEFGLTKDLTTNIPPYAILSHTWGNDDEEVTFKDMTKGPRRTKVGYRKLRFCAEQASRDGLQHFWVDTCCIDKSNNTELSEAINSMFRWYQSAKKCYVYLSDFATNEHDTLETWEPSFRSCRWFTRGWTLQELLAPPSVEFFCSNWRKIGSKTSLEQQICEVTGIVARALKGTPLAEFTVDERMLWAKSRQTARAEDKTYCLLGIFNVYLPLIYGEGEENASLRLREEIDKRSRKHQLDGLSSDPQSLHDSSKRPKSVANRTLVVPSRTNHGVDDSNSSFRHEASDTAGMSNTSMFTITHS